MIDLTPLDVRKKRGDFRRGLRGYDPEEVDTFMDLVAERFEELVRENLSHAEKAGRIEAQLRALESRESAVQEALVTAQKLREDVQNQSRRDAESLKGQALREAEAVKEQATREAELLKAEAEGEIARRLGEAEGLILERQRAMEELDRNRMRFLKGFRGLLEREMDAVEVEEARRPLDDTPLDLDFRSWTPRSGESDEGADEAPGGFESQLLNVTDTLEAPPEVEADAVLDEVEALIQEAEAAAEEADALAQEAEAVTQETETILFEAESSSDEAEGVVLDAETAEDGVEAEAYELQPEVVETVAEPEPDPEWEEGLVVSDEEEGSPESGGFTGEDGDPHTDDLDAASGAPHDPYDVADLAPDGGDAPGIEAEPDPAHGGPEPKWLFSLLKREEEEREGEE